MPTLSYDGQSLMLDGRRLWLASGTIYYPRIPHVLWRRRIRAAKFAGLNCIDVPVFWSVHEPRSGHLTFEGQADLRHFVQTIAQEGLYCLLRPGPYINAGADLGGLPAWLLVKGNAALRQNSPGFLEAMGRYLTAVLGQVKDLQANPPSGAGGPILLMQAEHQWLCNNPDQTTGYLREVVRYLREAGCTVPIVSANNLWQQVDGTIDAWCSDTHLAGDLRQLRAVRPQAPVLAIDLPTASPEYWGGPRQPGINAAEQVHRLAQVLAVGGQFNLSPFHGGTNFGSLAGRSCESPAAFLATAHAPGTPLTETGQPTPSFAGLKRIATFASQFGHVLAHAEQQSPPTVVSPDQQDHALSVVHQGGSQGNVVFIFRPAGDPSRKLDLLLPEGLTLQVPLDDDQVAWLVTHVNLAGVAELTATNLRPWAFIGKRLLVLFGPPGTSGLVNINGTPLTVQVPTGDEPSLSQHEGLTVAVLSIQQVDAAFVLPAGLAVGAAELDDNDQPIPTPGRRVIVIGLDGRIEPRKSLKPSKPAAPPRLTGWAYAHLTELIDGTSPAYKPIAGPASLESLSPTANYGWYGLSFKSPASGSMLAPGSGDRLHFFTDAQPRIILGLGPGAQREPAPLKLTTRTVVLAENLGRFSDGWNLAQPKGLTRHLHRVSLLKLGKPSRTEGRVPDPFVLSGYIKYRRRENRVAGDWFKWTISAKGKTPLILDVAGLPQSAVIVVNDQPVGLYDPVQTAGWGRFLLEPGQALKNGKNELAVVFFDRLPAGKSAEAEVSKHVRLYQSKEAVTAQAEWSFAPWTVPPATAFQAKSPLAHRPGWARCAFNVPRVDRPLRLTLDGLSKGEAYLNGQSLGRYFVATAAGAAVGPQRSLYLPEPWIKTDGPNELLIFDEHGKSAEKCGLKLE